MRRTVTPCRPYIARSSTFALRVGSEMAVKGKNYANTNLTWLSFILAPHGFKLARQVVESVAAPPTGQISATQLHAISLCQVRACVKSKISLRNADALWAEMGIPRVLGRSRASGCIVRLAPTQWKKALPCGTEARSRLDMLCAPVNGVSFARYGWKAWSRGLVRL